MSKRRTIQKILLLCTTVLVAGGLITLLVAANQKDEQHLCKRVAVTIKGEGDNLYIDKGDILSQLKKTAGGTLVNKPVSAINLARLEKSLEKQMWIRDAELYFDSRYVLHVLVSEREPIARVFTTAGNSFYMDSSGHRLPLLEGMSIRVPVITGFTAAKKLNKKDSALLKELTTLTQYIGAHEFWAAQIAQIDVTPAGKFELVPVVGNHIIRIGHVENIEEKLNRLFLFYKQVMRKTGFDKYAVVDVQYKDQVIGSNDRNGSAIDSIQLQKNIKDLIDGTRLRATADSLAAVQAANNPVKEDTISKRPIETIQPNPIAVKPKENPNPVKTAVSRSKPVEKPKKKTTTTKNKPKAVMQRVVH